MNEEVRKIIQNRDNDYLLPLGNERVVIGYVDEVNGNGAIEEPGFVPTRHELLQLVQYWTERVVDIRFFWFCYQQFSSCESRMLSFAQRRISRIAELLGDEIVEKVIEDVYEKLSQRHDPRAWEVFTNGDDDQERAFHDEMGRHMSRQGCNSQCKTEHRHESHELDWTWIEQETQMHRQGQCSVDHESY